MIVGFVPTILYLLAVYLSYEVGGMINVALRFVVLALLGAIIMLVIILKLINRVSLEYISNLHR
jgi:chromate transport protein ChrA